MNAPMMAAAAGLPGIPMVRRGTKEPPVQPLLAASEAITPSGIPVPNSSGCLERFFAMSYETKLAILPPAAGIIPITIPQILEIK